MVSSVLERENTQHMAQMMPNSGLTQDYRHGWHGSLMSCQSLASFATVIHLHEWSQSGGTLTVFSDEAELERALALQSAVQVHGHVGFCLFLQPVQRTCSTKEDRCRSGSLHQLCIPSVDITTGAVVANWLKNLDSMLVDWKIPPMSLSKPCNPTLL